MYCTQCGAEVNSGGKFCSKCGAVVVGGEAQSATGTTAIQSNADPQLGKTTKKSMSNTKALLIGVSVAIMLPLVLSLLLFALVRGEPSTGSSGDSTISATSDASKAIIKFAGEPDLIESSEYDKPRPPIVMKTFTYKKRNVKLYFVADAPLNAPPPYDAWGLVNASDAQTGETLSIEEFERRMGLP